MPRTVAVVSALLLALMLSLWSAPCAAATRDANRRTAYTTRFDNIDLERILSSRRLVAHYVDCLLGRKRCPPEGAELKRVLPDALATRCARCSERQREAAVRAIRLLRQRYPDLWAPLQLKWDPTGEHTRRLEQAASRRASSAAGAPARASSASHGTPVIAPAAASAARPVSATARSSFVNPAAAMHATPTAADVMAPAAAMAARPVSASAGTGSVNPAAAAASHATPTAADVMASAVALAARPVSRTAGTDFVNPVWTTSSLAASAVLAKPDTSGHASHTSPAAGGVERQAVSTPGAAWIARAMSATVGTSSADPAAVAAATTAASAKTIPEESRTTNPADTGSAAVRANFVIPAAAPSS